MASWMQWRTRCSDFLRNTGEFLEDQWFDRTRGVRTSGNVTLLSAGVGPAEHRDSELYQPARPRHIREALRVAPVPQHAHYTYIDLGSGKGRTLFVAAEFPFRRILGVEFSERLHREACDNVRSFRSPRRRVVEPVCQNAMEFPFPDGPLVIYMFNPFGRKTMELVLARLQRSLQSSPRHVVIILLWPRCGDLVAAMDGMAVTHENRYLQIFSNEVDCA